MPKIQSQRDARAVQKLPFCYVCGLSFDLGVNTNIDHIPPEAAFLAEDRQNFPLLLPTHVGCNHFFNLEDEILGQLLGLGHRQGISSDRLEILHGTDASGADYALLGNLDLRGVIHRWVSAFHAALYQEPLPPATQFAIQTPLPSAVVARTHAHPDVQLPQFKVFAERIKINENLGLVDLIVSNNSKMRYVCCWQRADNGQWLAFFRIELYEWNRLGDLKHFQERPCVGSYTTSGHLPALATKGTDLWDIRA